MPVYRCCFTATKSINLRFSHHHSCHSTCQPDNMVGSDDRDGSEWLVAMLDGISWGCWVGWEDMGWVWIGLVKNDVDMGRVFLYLCICVLVYLVEWVMGCRGLVCNHTQGSCKPGGTRAAPAWRKSRVLCPHHPSGSCIRLASRSPPPATSHHILSRCTNCL